MTTNNRQSLSNTTPLRLTPNGLHSSLDFTIQNSNDAGYIYIGGSDALSSSNYGFRILPNHSISFELPSSDPIYALASTSDMYVSTIYTSLEF